MSWTPFGNVPCRSFDWSQKEQKDKLGKSPKRAGSSRNKSGKSETGPQNLQICTKNCTFGPKNHYFYNAFLSSGMAKNPAISTRCFFVVFPVSVALICLAKHLYRANGRGGFGWQTAANPSGGPRRAPEEQTVGTVTASQKMLTLQALSGSLNAGTAKRGCLV